ncbi:MAG: hypothetical protein IPK75_07310 [Acidobacteria bacterium]|nr:hypothetical protein [Acidobacteriota bacterium]
MILRRLTKHVRDQNWFAVGLDFLIVVLGILIAFQITNWSNERENRRVYDQALERVVVELNSNLAMQDRVRKNIAIELPVIQTALEDLRACRADKDALANVKAALVPLNAPYVLLLQTAAVEQFLGNEAFLQYQSVDAREQLTEFLRLATFALYYDRAFSEQSLQNFASVADALSVGPLAVSGPDEILAVMLSDSPLSPPLYREPIIALPLEEACKDKAFVGLFYEWEATAFRVSITAGSFEPRLRKALSALGRPVAETEGATP